VPSFSQTWNIAVMYGPHGAPDFFTKRDIERFFEQEFEIHLTQVVQAFV
jgi:urea carboxylase